MKQISFADAEHAGKRKQTRRERFMIEMVEGFNCLDRNLIAISIH